MKANDFPPGMDKNHKVILFVMACTRYVIPVANS